MSDPVSDDWNSQENTQIPPSPSCTDASSNEIPDAIERRRMQNRLAQRNHRRKVRDHISALEARVIENMLLSPVEASLPTPSPSPASQYSTFIPAMESPNAHAHQASEQILDFSLDFPKTTDQTCTFPPMSQAESQAGQQGGCPTCATSCAFMRTRYASYPESSSTASSIGKSLSWNLIHLWH
ncbi:hypothetical protein B0O99DRAFT_154337 [Bisporella sp. PMI_857]|nr:hypothetical protein B0O99DRAFT_154337 [Bisporella sp. PMI_857]